MYPCLDAPLELKEISTTVRTRGRRYSMSWCSALRVWQIAEPYIALRDTVASCTHGRAPKRPVYEAM